MIEDIAFILYTDVFCAACRQTYLIIGTEKENGDALDVRRERTVVVLQEPRQARGKICARRTSRNMLEVNHQNTPRPRAHKLT